MKLTKACAWDTHHVVPARWVSLQANMVHGLAAEQTDQDPAEDRGDDTGRAI